MTVKLQDLIDARRLCVDTLADLDAAIAKHKVGYTITERLITDKGGNVLYRLEDPVPRPQDVIQFERRFGMNDWHKHRRITTAHSMHMVYDDYSNVRYSCRDAVLSGWNAISRLVRAARDAIQARQGARGARPIRSTAVRRTSRAGAART